MNGTDPLGEAVQEPAGPPAVEPAPVPVVSIRLAGLRTFQTVDDEGEPVLVVTDGESSVEFSCGLPGLSDVSARGARRLVEAIRAYQAEIALRQRPISTK